eukprot:scaffold4363_cov125-Cylindrotheca_fusiformis.AAC.6
MSQQTFFQKTSMNQSQKPNICVEEKGQTQTYWAGNSDRSIKTEAANLESGLAISTKEPKPKGDQRRPRKETMKSKESANLSVSSSEILRLWFFCLGTDCWRQRWAPEVALSTTCHATGGRSTANLFRAVSPAFAPKYQHADLSCSFVYPDFPKGITAQTR